MSNNQNQGQEGQTPKVSTVAYSQQQWQYRQEVDCTIDELNYWGAQGWRLVGTPVSKTALGTSGQLIYVFERPVKR